MDYSMNSAGVCTPCIREYETDITTDMPRGTVVALSAGKVIKATDSSSVLGITSHDYVAERDELIPCSGNGRVKVVVSPGTLCRMARPSFTVTEAGTATTVKAAGISAPSASNAFAGGYVKLVSKKENSTNTDNVGIARKITASSGTTLTLEAGGTPCAGDVYEIILPAGFEYLVLSDDSRFFNVASSKSTIAKVVANLPENGYAEVCFTKTFFN